MARHPKRTRLGETFRNRTERIRKKEIEDLPSSPAGGSSLVAAKVYRDTDQTTGLPFVAFSDVDYDTAGGSWSSGAADRLVVPEAAVYRVAGGAAGQISGAGGTMALTIAHYASDDTLIEFGDQFNHEEIADYAAGIAELQCSANAGDYFQLVAAGSGSLTLVSQVASLILSPWLAYYKVAA